MVHFCAWYSMCTVSVMLLSERMRSQMRAFEMSFLWRAAVIPVRDRISSSVKSDFFQVFVSFWISLFHFSNSMSLWIPPMGKVKVSVIFIYIAHFKTTEAAWTASQAQNQAKNNNSKTIQYVLMHKHMWSKIKYHRKIKYQSQAVTTALPVAVPPMTTRCWLQNLIESHVESRDF